MEQIDLTVEDSTESECGELEGSQLPVAQSRPSALAPEVAVLADSERGHPQSRRLVLVGTHCDSVRPTELDPVRCTAIDV